MDVRIKKFLKQWVACFIGLFLVQLSVLLAVAGSKRSELLNESVFVQGSLFLIFALSICLVLAFNAIKNGLLFNKTLFVITKKEAGNFLFYSNVIIFLSCSIIMGGAFIFLLIAMST